MCGVRETAGVARKQRCSARVWREFETVRGDQARRVAVVAKLLHGLELAGRDEESQGEYEQRNHCDEQQGVGQARGKRGRFVHVIGHRYLSLPFQGLILFPARFESIFDDFML